MNKRREDKNKKKFLKFTCFTRGNAVFKERSSIHKMGRGISTARHVFSQMCRKGMQKKRIA